MQGFAPSPAAMRRWETAASSSPSPTIAPAMPADRSEVVFPPTHAAGRGRTGIPPAAAKCGAPLEAPSLRRGCDARKRLVDGGGDTRAESRAGRHEHVVRERIPGSGGIPA
jgi:hypothetical protein